MALLCEPFLIGLCRKAGFATTVKEDALDQLRLLITQFISDVAVELSQQISQRGHRGHQHYDQVVALDGDVGKEIASKVRGLSVVGQLQAATSCTGLTGGVVSQFSALASKLRAEQESNPHMLKARHWNVFTRALYAGIDHQMPQQMLFTLVKMRKLLDLERARVISIDDSRSLGLNLIAALCCANLNDR